LNFANGNFERALDLNEEIMQIDPGESLPYVNFGNYYMIMGDTLKGVSFFEQAVVKGAPSQVSVFLMRYYNSKGDRKKSDYYMSIIKEQNPGTMPRKQ
jgi:tetratricopeptide (TPR) repeat protein